MDIEQFINAVQDKNFAEAEPMFKGMMQDRITSALDNEKIAIANQVYNGVEPEEPEPEVESDDNQLELELEPEETNDKEEVEGHPV